MLSVDSRLTALETPITRLIVYFDNREMMFWKPFWYMFPPISMFLQKIPTNQHSNLGDLEWWLVDICIKQVAKHGQFQVMIKLKKLQRIDSYAIESFKPLNTFRCQYTQPWRPPISDKTFSEVLYVSYWDTISI